MNLRIIVEDESQLHGKVKLQGLMPRLRHQDFSARGIARVVPSEGKFADERPLIQVAEQLMHNATVEQRYAWGKAHSSVKVIPAQVSLVNN
jgi:hypothetical protein